MTRDIYIGIRLILILVALFGLSACAADQMRTMGIVTQGIGETAATIGSFLPPPWGQLATLLGVAVAAGGGTLAQQRGRMGKEKEASYKTGRRHALFDKSPRR